MWLDNELSLFKQNIEMLNWPFYSVCQYFVSYHLLFKKSWHIDN